MGTGKKSNKNSGSGCGLFVVLVILAAVGVFTGTLPYMIVIAVICGIIIAVIYIIAIYSAKRKKAAKLREIEVGLQDIEKGLQEIETEIDRIHSESLLSTPISLMSPLEYEEYIAAYLKNKGYRNVHTTKASGDFGADVLCEYSYGIKVCIQCKHYNKPVGGEAVQQVFSAKAYYECDEAWVCASNTFTSAAHELADKTGVKLITIDDTTEPIYNYYVNQKEDDPEDLLYKKIRKDIKKKLDSGMRAHSKQLPYIERTPEYIKMYSLESHEKVIELKSEPFTSQEAAQHFSECLSDSFLCDSYVEQEGKVYYVYSGYLIKSVVSSYRLNSEDKYYTFANWS